METSQKRRKGGNSRRDNPKSDQAFRSSSIVKLKETYHKMIKDQKSKQSVPFLRASQANPIAPQLVTKIQHIFTNLQVLRLHL